MPWASKAWNLCQVRGCMRRTRSGETERELSKRWCAFHAPSVAARREFRRKEALFLASTCRVRLRWTLKTPPTIVVGNVTAFPKPLLQFVGSKCVDPELRWKRKRCKEDVGLSSRRHVFPPQGMELTWCILCAGAFVVDPDVVFCHDCC